MSGLRYHFGPFTLDVDRRRLYRGSEPVPLTPKAFDTLLLLVEHPHTVIDKDDLIQRLWPDTVVEEANLTQHIFTLRKTLREYAPDRQFIATVPRRGYRFLAEVRVDKVLTGAARASTGPARRPLRFTIALPEEAPAARLPVPTLALAPDGSTLLYVARCGRHTVLARRSLSELGVEPIAGTEGASTPFWSPDGAWFGFAAGGVLKRMPRHGGAAHAMADAPECRGATWTTTQHIVYSPGPAEGLWIVEAEGGRPRPLTSVDFAAGERTHRWPAALPDSRVLFTIGSAGIASFDEASLAVVSVETGARETLRRRASDGRPLAGPLPSARNRLLVFVRDGALCVDRLDAPALSGAVPALTGVAIESTGVAQFTCSADGTLIYMPGGRHVVRRELVWIDRSGGSTAIAGPQGEIEEPRLSPAGDRIAVGVRRGTSDIWIVELERAVCSRFTAIEDNFAPIWTPDGQRVTFSSNRLGPTNIFWKRSDGSEDEALLVHSAYDLVPGSWSPDGRLLLFTEYHPDTGADIWVARADGSGTEPVLRTRFNEYSPCWSPDGRWFAFTSDESGTQEVYVRRFPSGARIQVSRDGGREPLWTRDGRGLIYRAGNSLVMTGLTIREETASVGDTTHLLEHAGEPGTETGLPNYDVSLDGARFLVVRALECPAAAPSLTVVLNWFDELAQLMV
ncbi:MAG TPA: winged helix-turn-helix domain-containing protein [Vicinamibacterales bacterium]|nr:winged helix-turn-helix domain-containing protein [Vicinamibacterales bacterium]